MHNEGPATMIPLTSSRELRNDKWADQSKGSLSRTDVNYVASMRKCKQIFTATFEYPEKTTSGSGIWNSQYRLGAGQYFTTEHTESTERKRQFDVFPLCPLRPL